MLKELVYLSHVEPMSEGTGAVFVKQLTICCQLGNSVVMITREGDTSLKWYLG